MAGGCAVALAFVLVAGEALAQAQILSTRIWPAHAYTRVTVESNTELKFSVFGVKDPERLVVDIEGAEFGPAIAELQDKVAAGDPYIAKLRAGRNRPGVLRIVLDLKSEVKPQVFTLKPIANYGHRLVLDLYPLVAPDPLAALINPPAGWPLARQRRNPGRRWRRGSPQRQKRGQASRAWPPS